jgi:hypothetical protein
MKTFAGIVISFSALTFFSCNGNGESDIDPLDTVKTGKEYCIESLLQYNSEKQLQQKFGAKRITRNSHYQFSILDEGTVNEVTFTWSDTANYSGLWKVYIMAHANDEGGYNYQNQWHSATGMRLGLTHDEVEKMNGKPYAFDGFCVSVLSSLFGGCGSQGYILDWKGGKLQNCKWQSVQLGIDILPEGISEDEKKKLEYGPNKTLMSNSPLINRVRPRVQLIGIFKQDYPGK